MDLRKLLPPPPCPLQLSPARPSPAQHSPGEGGVSAGRAYEQSREGSGRGN